MINIIKKKKSGLALSEEEISFLITNFMAGLIPDYQISAWLMAVCFQGLNENETAALTKAMMNSGEVVDLSSIPGLKVDKHSTGGVGDKATIIVAPMVASASVPVAKLSGRGLGHTGGTADKLEAIPGFNLMMSNQEFVQKVKSHHIAICTQSKDFVPADQKLYALRDVTGTIDDLSLISSSIMCKKLACGADGFVIDIKVGEGAFIKTVQKGEELAHKMISTARQMNKKCTVVISAMDQPLGKAVGNSLEVIEAIQTLKGEGPSDLTDLCIDLAAHMLVLGGKASDMEDGRLVAKETISSGKAMKKFEEMVEAQGGDIRCVHDPTIFGQAAISIDVRSTVSGFVTDLKALEIGLASVELGAGRKTKESLIDLTAGILLNKKIGDYVQIGETLATLFTSETIDSTFAQSMVLGAYTFGDIKPEISNLTLKTITS